MLNLHFVLVGKEVLFYGYNYAVRTGQWEFILPVELTKMLNILILTLDLITVCNWPFWTAFTRNFILSFPIALHYVSL